MKSNILAIFICVLAGCSQPTILTRGIVVESNTPAIGKNSTLTESIGIEILGGVFTPVIESGVSIPCRKTHIFSTAADNQDQILLTLSRGNAEMTKGNKQLGYFQIQDIPPSPRGTPQIQVSFIITTTDIILEAEDLLTDKQMKIEKIEKSSQQSGPAYPPQGVGSADP